MCQSTNSIGIPIVPDSEGIEEYKKGIVVLKLWNPSSVTFEIKIKYGMPSTVYWGGKSCQKF